MLSIMKKSWFPVGAVPFFSVISSKIICIAGRWGIMIGSLLLRFLPFMKCGMIVALLKEFGKIPASID